MTDKTIIFYDNDCVMCSRFVRFILNNEPGDVFRFCPLSRISEFEHIELNNSTIVVKSDGNFHFESGAIFLILRKLKFPVNVLCIGLVIPRSLTDFIYRIVSRNRGRIMSKSSCWIWSTSEKRKFL